MKILTQFICIYNTRAHTQNHIYIYINIKEHITVEKNLALKLKKENKIEWAKLALTRAKIMQNEVDEVEGA